MSICSASTIRPVSVAISPGNPLGLVFNSFVKTSGNWSVKIQGEQELPAACQRSLENLREGQTLGGLEAAASPHCLLQTISQ